jgi:hypothetical protein
MLLFHFLRDHGTISFCHPTNAFWPYLHFPESRFQKRPKSISGVAKTDGSVVAQKVKKEHVLLMFFSGGD